MRALLPESGPDPSVSSGLHVRYQPPRRRWARANMITSADGAASLDGVSGGLGSEADKAVLATLRDHADVIVVGAGTVRAENYGSPSPSSSRRSRRLADGRAEVPVLAVVGSADAFTGQERWIVEATAPPLILTSAQHTAAVTGAEVIVCGEKQVDPATARAELEARQLASILCEGGPGLLSQLLAAHALDELCLTYAPVLAGPGAGRILTGQPWPAANRLILTMLLEDEGLLFARYGVGASD